MKGKMNQCVGDVVKRIIQQLWSVDIHSVCCVWHTQSERQLKCIQCSKISTVSSYELQIIEETIRDKVIPMIGSEDMFRQNKIQITKNKRNSSRKSIAQKTDKIYSQQPSFQNMASSVKQFFSKYSSPNHRIKDLCILHPNHSLTFLCFTCNNQLLCPKCANSKHHHNHDLKSIKKGIQLIVQQINLAQLETKEKIQCMQMWQRRLEHGQIYLKDHFQNTFQEIVNCFKQLQTNLTLKQDELLMSCNQHFQYLMKQINQRSIKISDYITNYGNYQSKLQKIIQITSEQHFIKEFNKLKIEINKSGIGTLEPKLLQNVSFQSISMHQQIAKISESIKNIKIQYRPAHIIMTKSIGEAKSDKKIKKDDMIKKNRNIGSLNSSRDKRECKWNKTEEDQARKQKITYEQFKKNKELPTYITKFFDKHNIKPFHNGMSCIVDLHPFINNQKTSSKILSKSVVPEQLNKKKKKDHFSQTKDRLQRKTTNPSLGRGLGTDNHQKKKY